MRADRVALVRAWFRVRIGAARRVLSAIAGWTRAVRAELLQLGALLTGWGALTYGVRLVLPTHAARAAWPISLGLLLLSACGWGFLIRVAGVGIYALTRKTGSG